MQGELGFEQFLFGIGETEVGENVAAAFCCARGALLCLLCFGFHFSFAFLDGRNWLRRPRVWREELSWLPGVEDGDVEVGEVGDVAGDDGEVVVEGGCGEETIDHRESFS